MTLFVVIWLISILTKLPGTVSISEKELIICEHSSGTINCLDSVIRIKNASYGRHDSTTCDRGKDVEIKTTNCHADNSLDIVNGECNGKSSCSFRASNDVFGDPCQGTYKYLFVSYICEKQGVVQCFTETLQENFSNYTISNASDFANKTALLVFNKILDGNKTNSIEAQCLIEDMEDTFVRMLDTVLNSTLVHSIEISNDLLSVTVVKTSGYQLKSFYRTEYGEVELPEWGTFKDKLEQDNILIHIISYAKNPYVHISNSAKINSAILTVKAVNQNEDEVSLEDPDDPAIVGIDSTSVLSNQSTWTNMNKLNSYDGGYLIVTTIKKGFKTMLLEINLEGETCVIYGKYGNILPDVRVPDLKLSVVNNGISEFYPKDVTAFLNNGLLQTVLRNRHPNKDDHDLTFLVHCPGTSSRTKPAIKNFAKNSGYRTSIVNAYYLDKHSKSWTSSADLQIDSVKGNMIRFKTTFFSTFAVGVNFMPPTPINLQAVFSNFGEKFAETPHVFATQCVLIITFILLSVQLCRQDKKDAILWNYLPLIDNPDDGSQEYFLSIYTSVRSAQAFTSNAFINIIGTHGQTGTRILMDGVRENFKPGTLSCFRIVTNKYIGTIKRVKVWHDNTGKSPRWLLDKIIIADTQLNKRYLFSCGKWLSLDSEDGKIWQRLYVRTKEKADSDPLFAETFNYRLFDDHLWLSIYKRPNFSRFSRVQRLWTLVALLYLAMVTSAMWYKADDVYSRNAVKVGPFKISYKEVYVGLVSSVIAIVPSFLIVTIFKYRRFKDEIKKTDGNYLISNQKKDVFLFPWGVIFIAYGLILAVIVASGTFTFLYSLEWGRDITLEWMISFIMGIAEGIFLIEPTKVVVFAFILTCLCSASITKTTCEVVPLKRRGSSVSLAHEESKFNIRKVECPDKDSADDSLHEVRRRIHLDKRLRSFLSVFILGLIYLTMLCLMVTHNKVSESFVEKNYVEEMLTSNVKPDTVEGIWEWIEDSLIKKVFPKRWYNGNLRSAYQQRFIDNGYSYRLGYTRIRQVRVKGQCSVSKVMRPAVYICSSSYSYSSEEKNKFCKGWQPYNISCFGDKNKIDESFIYSPSDGDVSTEGLYSQYDGGGGYHIDIGPHRAKAEHYIKYLKSLVWIDNYTRAVFVDFTVFNPSTRLHCHFQIIFEISPFGDIHTASNIWAANLYPYMVSWDYIILVIQLIFLIIMVVRIVQYCIFVCKLKSRSCYTLQLWIGALRLLFCTTAVILYILRIDSTISSIEKLNNNLESFVPFGKVHVLDDGYRMCLSAEVFLAILDLLKPLTFNYYLYLMRTSIVMSLGQIIASTIILSILIVAFSTLLFLTVGPYTTDLRDIASAMLSMTRLSLTMAKFKNTLSDVDSLAIQLVFVVYMILMAFIMINFFVAILSSMFGVMKSNSETIENVDGFDNELNEHFWWKMDQFGSKIADLLCLGNKNESDRNGYVNRVIPAVFEEKLKFDVINRLVSAESEEYIHCTELLVENRNVLLNSPCRNILLQRTCKENERMKYTFTTSDGTIVLVMKIPYTAYTTAVRLRCIDVSTTMDEELFPFEHEICRRKIYQIQKRSPHTMQGTVVCEIYDVDPEGLSDHTEIVASFNHGKTWEAFRVNYIDGKISQDGNSCVSVKLDVLPTHITVRGNRQFEIFHVTADGAVIHPFSDSDVQITTDDVSGDEDLGKVVK